jgi:DNA-binding NarL/FixJ family response regulator
MRLGTAACGSFVEHLRRHDLTAPAIVITSSDADARHTEEALRLSPRDRVLSQAGLADELASAVKRVTGLAADVPASSPDPAAASLLAQLQAAVDRAERVRQTEAKAAAARLDNAAPSPPTWLASARARCVTAGSSTSRST